MPWSCPKCGFLVGIGGPNQLLPQSGTTYTCPVCHLALEFNPAKKKMESASLPPTTNRKSRKRRTVA